MIASGCYLALKVDFVKNGTEKESKIFQKIGLH